MQISGQRLLEDLKTLAGFGQVDSGVTRLSYSHADRVSRDWLVERMTDAGLDAAIDGIGNVYGRARDTGQAVLVGSHTDSVPKGGWLDGAMGVMYGLELARAWRDAGGAQGKGIDVISFADEEGTYLPTAGSRAFCGLIEQNEIDQAKSVTGKPMTAALSKAGYAGRPVARLDPARHIAYFEGHIEQGPRLEAAGVRIGVVTGIVGIGRAEIVFIGRADHAGTTPMALRRDAVNALIACAHRLGQRFTDLAGADTVWNFGDIRVEPGSRNVVPARASLLVEYRDLSTDRLAAMAAAVETTTKEVAVELPIDVDLVSALGLTPSRMDDQLRKHIDIAVSELGVSAMAMPSGAGHDAMIVAPIIPSAMIFIPSIGGRSHDISEDSAPEDIVLGAEVLARAIGDYFS